MSWLTSSGPRPSTSSSMCCRGWRSRCRCGWSRQRPMPEPRRCSQEGCTAAAEWRVFWPGEAPLLACTPHKMHALNLGTAMGVAIHAELLPLDPAALVWTSEMGEISGMGGSYERGLQAMVRAGLAWWDAHPDADPRFKGYENVMG